MSGKFMTSRRALHLVPVAAIVVLSSLVLLPGCTAKTDKAENIWPTLIGVRFSDIAEDYDAYAGKKEGTSFAVQDISPAVGRDAYEGQHFMDAPEATRWTVVAACGNGPNWAIATQVEVAIIPSDAITPDVEKRILSGDFINDTGCEGTEGWYEYLSAPRVDPVLSPEQSE